MQDMYQRSIQGDINRQDALKLVYSNPFQLFNLADKLRQDIVGEGGTMMEDKISIAAGASHGEHLPRDEMHKIIKSIGREPVERNTLYQPVKK
ncbi:MAG: hypothetical protein LUQ24_08930 [Methanobacterium sp.]|nr:hypothetical protein [Methanobacterium sp.]